MKLPSRQKKPRKAHTAEAAVLVHKARHVCEVLPATALTYLPGASDVCYGELIAVQALALLHAVMHLTPICDFPYTHHQGALQQRKGSATRQSST